MNSKEQGIVGLALGGRLGLRRKVSIAAFAAVSMIGGAASAQNVTWGAPKVDREPEPTRQSPYTYDINRAECEANDKFKFLLSFGGMGIPTGYQLQVWGTAVKTADCMQADQRNPGSTQQCYDITPAIVPQPGTAVSGEVELDAQTIVSLDKSGVTNNCGADSTTPTTIDVRLYFMLFSNNAPGTPAIFPSGTGESMTIDLWGPVAPTEINATGGDASISVTPKPPEGDQLDGFVMYCAQSGNVVSPAGSDASSDSGCAWSVDATGITGGSGGGGGTTASSGGSGGTGGAGGAGGSSGDTECPSSIFVRDARPDLNWVPCATNGTAEGLENGASVTVAVAYKDVRGNIGLLSDPVCVTPEPMDDFFEHYNRSGGKGGGGFCSISHRSRKATSFGVSFALAALALAYRRRARQNRNAASKEVSQ